MCHWCSYHSLTSSVIYYWTDARQHGIYLLNGILKESHSMPEACPTLLSMRIRSNISLIKKSLALAVWLLIFIRSHPYNIRCLKKKKKQIHKPNWHVQPVTPGQYYFTIKLRKPWTQGIFMECFCVARKKPFRHEKTKPQTVYSHVLNLIVICQYTIDLMHNWPHFLTHAVNIGLPINSPLAISLDDIESSTFGQMLVNCLAFR